MAPGEQDTGGLSGEQLERYARNIALAEIGGEGQEKLASAKVLVVGLGGLGSPAALYLAAAGVGTIGIVDPGCVELPDLQRQILYGSSSVGHLKVDSAMSRLAGANPDVEIKSYPEALSGGNAAEILKEYDFVLDCTDSLEAKLLVGDAAFAAGKPLSHAGVLRFGGQAMTILPGRSACLRCVFSEEELARSHVPCSEAGVLGPVAGVMGAIQATEAVKCITGAGDLLTDVLLTYDALKAVFRRLKVSRNPGCPLCGESPPT